MATILNGLLPARKKDAHSAPKSMNTRWGDAAISAPMHGGWNTGASSSETSPDLDRDLPPTPPHSHDEEDGVFIVPEEEAGNQTGDDVSGADRDNVTITIPLPWKKKKTTTHTRTPSHPPVAQPINPRFGVPRRIDRVQSPPLGTAEAAAVPLPDSRVNSPVGRISTASPSFAFRNRLGTPNLADILSPVAEGFAKEGPSSRPATTVPAMSGLRYEPIERVSTSSSMRSNTGRRPSLTAYSAEGLGGATMSSQATVGDQVPEYNRPASRGIGATSRMRASSREPRPPSREQRSASVDPMARRGPSMDPYSRRAPSVGPDARQAFSGETEPFPPRPATVQPMFQQMDTATQPFIPAPIDLAPLRRRAPSVEPGRRRAPSVEPMSKMDTSIDGSRRREPSVERGNGRAPSIGPRSTRRAESREPRGRRGMSVEPTRVRFRSEAGRRTYRRDYSSSDESGPDSDEDYGYDRRPTARRARFDRLDPDSDAPHRPRRSHSIASPTAAAFDIAQIRRESPLNGRSRNIDNIATRAGLAIQPVAPAFDGPPSGGRPQGRGLYADMQNDFSMLAAEVQPSTSTSYAIDRTPIITQVPRSALNPSLRTISPVNPQIHPMFQSGIGSMMNTHAEPDRTGYASDSSYVSTGTLVAHGDRRHDDSERAMLAALARERKDQLRREEREKAREKVARKLDRERERVLAMNALSDCESMSGSEMNTRVYGGSAADIKHDPRPGKTLVPSAEDIWG